ncbi:DUF6130 family protein [Klebsiella sp. WOUb02]|uniref:DUF6130 family protein n=1 Tax=Klebsiella sp. WOUb02 TaxID=3161071 RepID=UPI003CF6CA1F
MNIIKYAALSFLGLFYIFSAHAAGQHVHSQPDAQLSSASASQMANEAKPKLTLFEPEKDVLKDGYVFLPFQVDNMKILPLYTEIHGKEATTLRPMIGHLHVMVDGNGWNWIHAITDPIYFGPLKHGEHQVKIELVDAAHSVIEVQTIKVVVP